MAESIDIRELNERIERQSAFVTNLTTGMDQIIVGQKHLVESLLIGLLSDGHVLLEGVPGLAKTLAIKRISSLKKAEIAEKVADELLNPEVMAKRLAILDDAQIALFEKAAKGAFMATEAEMDTAYEACALDYMQVSEEGMLEVTEDVAEAYEKMDQETFEKKRKDVSWLAKCLSFSAAMYGVAPVDTVRTVY